MRRACITGGAGFIGSNLADRLRAGGREVAIVDDFSTGRHEFIEHLRKDPSVALIEGDVLDQPTLERAFTDCDWVFHLQANADVRHGLEHPRKDLEQNTIATANVLEAMRSTGVSQIAFASTGSIYGEPSVFPTPENAPFPVQTSLYGASKLGGEAMIAAYAHGFGFRGVVFRFVSILGERYTHGHVYDFYRALRRDPTRLDVLGDGRQRKSYLYVGDCTAAMVRAVHHCEAGTSDAFTVFNLGTDETVTVNESIETICTHLDVSPQIHYAGGKRGWPGDSPRIQLDCTKMRQLGWTPQVTIREGIHRTLHWLDGNPYAWNADLPDLAAQSSDGGRL